MLISEFTHRNPAPSVPKRTTEPPTPSAANRSGRCPWGKCLPAYSSRCGFGCRPFRLSVVWPPALGAILKRYRMSPPTQVGRSAGAAKFAWDVVCDVCFCTYRRGLAATRPRGVDRPAAQCSVSCAALQRLFRLGKRRRDKTNKIGKHRPSAMDHGMTLHQESARSTLSACHLDCGLPAGDTRAFCAAMRLLALIFIPTLLQCQFRGNSGLFEVRSTDAFSVYGMAHAALCSLDSGPFSSLETPTAVCDSPMIAWRDASAVDL